MRIITLQLISQGHRQVGGVTCATGRSTKAQVLEWDRSLALPPTGRLVLGKLLHFFGSQFPHLKKAVHPLPPSRYYAEHPTSRLAHNPHAIAACFPSLGQIRKANRKSQVVRSKDPRVWVCLVWNSSLSCTSVEQRPWEGQTGNVRHLKYIMGNRNPESYRSITLLFDFSSCPSTTMGLNGRVTMLSEYVNASLPISNKFFLLTPFFNMCFLPLFSPETA